MSEKESIKHYTNGDITIVWQPGLCRHATKCWKGLPSVFDYQKRPWITIDGAETEAIIGQVNQCPSGALSFFKNAEAASK
ncbi:MAG: (4Fe-4S)-binding protein [Flavipsychrobacter sp.]